MPLTWFDAHLDLAYLAVCARDMTEPLDRDSRPHPPASITLPSLRDGNVRFALATIFTEPVTPPASPNLGDPVSPPLVEPQMYLAGDAARAYAAGRGQLEAYLTWRDRGLITFDYLAQLREDPGVGEIRAGMGVSQVIPPTLRQRLQRITATTPAPLRIGILMENADPIRSPDELAWWKSHGVVAIGLAWAKSSRYAGGNTTQDGLTPIGRELVREMDRLHIVHDVSHLSDRSLADLLEMTDAPVIASHSNCRALLGGENQRHLRDDTIREIGRRRGVIGLNLFSKFLLPPGAPSDAAQRATLDHCIAHIERVCELIGHRRSIGLGSDMDGGFSAAELPDTIDRPVHLTRLADALSSRGWTDDDLRAFACENWLRFFLNVTLR